MLVILFRSRLTEEAGDDYQDMAAEMRAYAKTQPGYVDFKSYQAEDGERISVVKWKDRKRSRRGDRMLDIASQEEWA